MQRLTDPLLSTARTPLRRWAFAWGLSLLVWAVLWVFLSAPAYIYWREKGGLVPWSRFIPGLGDHFVSALLTPLFLQVVWRYPIDRKRWSRHLPRQAVAALIFAATDVLVCQCWHLTLALVDPGKFESTSRVLGWYIMTIVTYAEIAAVGHAIHYYQESRHKDLRASQLEAQLAQAQLECLRMQLHPHFLFNTLNTIAALLHKDLDAADRMIARLGDLLRYSLDNVGAQEVTLKQELEFLDRYVEIEKTRFQDRLLVQRDVDPETLDASVPNLILQPLVENAIRHGVGRRSGKGRIDLVARRENGMLALSVGDNGPGLPNERQLTTRGGVGLANTQARLLQLYGDTYRFDLSNKPGGGVEVSVKFPFRVDLGGAALPAEPQSPSPVELAQAAHPTPNPNRAAASDV